MFELSFCFYEISVDARNNQQHREFFDAVNDEWLWPIDSLSTTDAVEYSDRWKSWALLRHKSLEQQLPPVFIRSLSQGRSITAKETSQ